jgi:hypothetical protein
MDKAIRVTPEWRAEVDIDRLVAALLRILEDEAREASAAPTISADADDSGEGAA